MYFITEWGIMKKYIFIIILAINAFLYSQYNTANKYDISKDEDRLFIYSEHGNYDGVKELLKKRNRS